jgi:hypothetical protein
VESFLDIEEAERRLAESLRDAEGDAEVAKAVRRQFEREAIFKRQCAELAAIHDRGRAAPIVDERKKVGCPRTLSAEQVRDMQARAAELRPTYHKGVQWRVAMVLRGEWEKRGIKVSLSTIRRRVLKPIGF